MRLLIVVASLVSFVSSNAPAETSGSESRIARNEVLLELVGRGIVQNPADKVTVTVTFTGHGASSAEARKAAEAQAAKLSAAARGAGIAESDLKLVDPLASGALFVGNEAADEGVAATIAQTTSASPAETSALEIRLRDPAQFGRLREALEAAGALVPDPRFELADDRAAREAAKARAVADARQEADAYARALGLRVARIVRVSERTPTDLSDPVALRDYFRITRSSGNGSSTVETVARVAVDFALAPR